MIWFFKIFIELKLLSKTVFKSVLLDLIRSWFEIFYEVKWVWILIWALALFKTRMSHVTFIICTTRLTGKKIDLLVCNNLLSSKCMEIFHQHTGSWRYNYIFLRIKIIINTCTTYLIIGLGYIFCHEKYINNDRCLRSVMKEATFFV